MGELRHLPIRIKEVEKIVTVEKEVIALPAYVYRLTEDVITKGTSIQERSNDYYDSAETFQKSRTVAIQDGRVVLSGSITNVSINSSNYTTVNRSLSGWYIAGGLIASNFDVYYINSVASQTNSRSYYNASLMSITKNIIGYTLLADRRYNDNQVVDGKTYKLMNTYS